MAPIGLLALRIAVALVFILMGYNKLFVNTNMTIQMFNGLGFPAASFWAYFIGVAELVGGVLVLLGIFTRVAASWLAAIMVVALLAVHIKGPLMSSLLPIVLLGATLALLGVGAGRYRLVRAECPCPKCMAMAKDGKCGDDTDGCCGNDEMKKEKMCACGGNGACMCDKGEVKK